MLELPLLYFKGMRLMMFQLSGFYCMYRVLNKRAGDYGPSAPTQELHAWSSQRSLLAEIPGMEKLLPKP